MRFQMASLKGDGLRRHFAAFKMGYEILANFVKSSSALVPRIENDCPQSVLSLMVEEDVGM